MKWKLKNNQKLRVSGSYSIESFRNKEKPNYILPKLSSGYNKTQNTNHYFRYTDSAFRRAKKYNEKIYTVGSSATKSSENYNKITKIKSLNGKGKL